MATILRGVIEDLHEWRCRNAGQEHGRCLEAVRWALRRSKLILPGPLGRGKGALDCQKLLLKNPEVYGWKRAVFDQAVHQLHFFGDCGVVAGRMYGHVAVGLDHYHYSNQVFPWTEYWLERRESSWVPIMTADGVPLVQPK